MDCGRRAYEAMRHALLLCKQTFSIAFTGNTSGLNASLYARSINGTRDLIAMRLAWNTWLAVGCGWLGNEQQETCNAGLNETSSNSWQAFRRGSDLRCILHAREYTAA